MSQSPAQRPLRTPISHETLGMIFGLIGVLIFSATLPATRIGIAFFDPWFLTFGRAVLASLAAAITLILLNRRLAREHWGGAFTIGMFLVYGFPGFVGLAMQTVPSSHGGVALGILPLATAFFATLWAGERPSLLFWFAGIAGTLIIILFALRDGGWGFEAGDGWLAIAGLCAAAGYVLAGKMSRLMPGWEVISWALVLTAPLSIIGAALFWDHSYLSPPAVQIVAFAYLGLGSMYLGFFAWNTGLALGGLARVGQLQLLQTFFTLGVAAFVLGETVTLETLAFALAILIIVLIGRSAKVAR